MPALSSPFAGAGFQKTIRELAAANEWELAEIGDERAVFTFEGESGREHALYIDKYDGMLEFSVPSTAAYDDEDLPHEISTLLLKRNAVTAIGFWCLEEIDGAQVYEYMANVDPDALDAETFATLVATLVAECDEFEGVLEEMSGGEAGEEEET